MSLSLASRSTDDSSSASPSALAGEVLLGPENRLAEIAVLAVARGSVACNPLVFWGPSGTGKTHLARALVALFRAHGRRGRVVQTDAAAFARELAEAIDTQSVVEFRARYREAELLVIDEIGLLAGKPAAQEELQGTIDGMLEAGGQIVATATRPPGQWSDLGAALQGRLRSGLVVPLAPPGPAVRREAARRLVAGQPWQWPGELLESLADSLEATLPQLQGAITQIALQAELESRPIAQADIQRFLDARVPARVPEIREIALATARHFSLKLAELRSPSRRRAVVAARGVAMFLARRLTGSSLEQVGAYFGGRDHTTVLHGCRKLEESLLSDPALRQAVLHLQQKLQAQ